MTDCDCPCHGDSEDAPSHEDGDCCPALAEADEALARALSENGRVLRREAAEIVALLEHDPPPDPRQTELPLWSAAEFTSTASPILGPLLPAEAEALTRIRLDELARHAGLMSWPENVIPIERARRKRGRRVLEDFQRRGR